MTFDDLVADAMRAHRSTGEAEGWYDLATHSVHIAADEYAAPGVPSYYVYENIMRPDGTPGPNTQAVVQSGLVPAHLL